MTERNVEYSPQVGSEPSSKSHPGAQATLSGDARAPGCPSYSGGGNVLSADTLRKKLPAEMTDRSTRAVPSGGGTASLARVMLADGGPATDLPQKFREHLNVREEEDLLRSPPPGPSGQGEDGFTSVLSKRNLKRQRQRLRRQQAVPKQAPGIRPPTGVTSAEAGGSVMGRPAKTKRQSTDPEERRPAKRRPGVAPDGPRCSAKEQGDLAVAIHRADGVPVDADMAEKIRDRLSDLILKVGRDGEDSDKLNFATSGLVAEGFFLVTPMNVMARDWLLSCDLGLYNGIKIKLSRRDRGKIAVWIPGKKRPDRDPLEYLQIQNRKRTELQIPDWTLIVREPLPQGERLILGVPQEVCHLFDKEGVWLCYELTRVHARLLKPRTRDKTGDPDVDMTDNSDCPSTGVTGDESGGASSRNANQRGGGASGDNSTPPQCPSSGGKQEMAGSPRLGARSPQKTQHRSEVEETAGPSGTQGNTRRSPCAADEG